MSKKLYHTNVIDLATRKPVPRSYGTKGNKYVNTIIDCLSQRRNQISDLMVIWRERDQTRAPKISSTPMTEEACAYLTMHLLGSSLVDYVFEEEEYEDD